MAHAGAHRGMTFAGRPKSFVDRSWWVVLAALLVVPCAIGSASSYIALAAALALLPILWRPKALAELRRQTAMVIFPGVFVVLLLCFAMSARTPANILYAANFLPMLLAPAVFLYAQSLKGETTLRRVAWLSLTGAALAVVVGLIELLLLHNGRAAGWASNPNVYARIALLLGFLSLFGTFVGPRTYRGFFYLGPALGIAAIILSGSRGAMVAAPLLALVFGSFVFIGYSGHRKLVHLGIATAMVTATTSLVMQLAGARFWTTLGAVSQTLMLGTSADGATSIRLTMYKAGFEAFLASPWVGYGWANLNSVAASQIVDRELAQIIADHAHLHNDFIDFAVAAGGFGLLCWLALLVAPILGALKTPRDSLFRARLYGAILLTVSYFAFGLTDMTLGYDILTTSYALLTAILLGSTGEQLTISAAHPIGSP